LCASTRARKARWIGTGVASLRYIGITNAENEMTDRGPTVINTGRSSSAGWAVAVIIAVLAVGALLMFSGVIDINGGGTDVNINVPAAGTTAPATGAAPPAAAPAAGAPAPSTGAPSK
jgi:hypothetical protein